MMDDEERSDTYDALKKVAESKHLLFPLIQNVPRKLYRMRDGSNGTEYEALSEALKTLEAEQRHLDERIELLKLRLATAEGHP